MEGNAQATGFTKSMGANKVRRWRAFPPPPQRLDSDHSVWITTADAQPDPIRLYIKPEHLAFMGEPVQFSKACFNIGDGEELSIVCRYE